MTKDWTVIALFGVALAATACKQSHADPRHDEATPSPPAAVAPAPLPKPTSEPEKPARVIEIASKGNLMEFDLKKLTAKEGERIRIVFANKSNLDVMPHNWVLIRPGTADKVGAAGQARADGGDFVEPSADVLAYTPVAKHGQTVEITFTAPAAGKYEYICSVMGHWVTMKGEFLVEK